MLRNVLFYIIFSSISNNIYGMQFELSPKKYQDLDIIQKFKCTRELLRESNKIRENNRMQEKVVNVNQKTDVITYSKSNNMLEPHFSDCFFGSIIINEKLSFQDKKISIQSLLNVGFKVEPIEKDLALLEWWERVPFGKMVFLKYIVDKKKNIYFSSLPSEVIKLIALQMAHTEESLL